MNYYKHNIGDFAVATSSLDLEEVGIFIRLIDRQVSTENPIKTAWVSFAFPEKAMGKVNRVLGGLFEETADGWVYPPAVEWIADFQSNAEKSRANGRKGGRPRKSTEISEEENPIGYLENPTGYELVSNENLDESEKKPNQEPGTKNHKPRTKKEEEGTRARAMAEPVAPPAALSVFNFDSLPDSWRDICEEMAPDLDPAKVFDEFAGFWAGKRKADWTHVWKTNIEHMPDYKREKLARAQEQKFAFGKISEKYAHVLANKLADTRDPALSSISYGILDWRDAANHYADMMLKSERGFEIVKEYLVKHNIVEA